MSRWPVANFLLIGFTSVFYFISMSGAMSLEQFDAMVLHQWKLSGLFGHLLLHGDPMHLFGNMLFLWVFGNAVCAKLGNFRFLGVYVLLGVAAACAHNLLDDGRAIGASGAINGVIGMFLVFYPRNDISCAYWFFGRAGVYSCDSRFMILLWLAFDLWGAMSAEAGVAYFAHLGGFAAGFLVAAALLIVGTVRMSPLEESLLKSIPGLKRFAESRPDDQEDDVPRAAPSSPFPTYNPSGADTTAAPPQASTLVMECVCGKRLKVPAQHAGKRARCTSCGAVVQIPA